MPSCPSIVTRLAPRLIVLFALLALCGCGRLGNRADLVCLNGPESELLDPPLITAQATSRIAYAVFEGLTAFNAKASRSRSRPELGDYARRTALHLSSAPQCALEQRRARSPQKTSSTRGGAR
ncbi:MAG: hypothetical protein WDN28_11865 [Chthoniobacter sp.]